MSTPVSNENSNPAVDLPREDQGIIGKIDVGITSAIDSLYMSLGGLGGQGGQADFTFFKADNASGSVDGLLTQAEAEAAGLTYVDTDGDGFMSKSEIDLYVEADKADGVVDDRVTIGNAFEQRIGFSDGFAEADGGGVSDGLMSRNDYLAVQAGQLEDRGIPQIVRAAIVLKEREGS